MKISHEFIPYDQALELTILNYNEVPITEHCYADPLGLLKNAITYSQAFRLFREKYTLASQIHPIESSGQFIWQYLIRNLSEYLTEFDLENFIFDTYEEAELACLKKLIEIVKQNIKTL